MGNFQNKETKTNEVIINQSAVANLQNLHYFTYGLCIVFVIIFVAIFYFVYRRCKKGTQKWIWKEILGGGKFPSTNQSRQITTQPSGNVKDTATIFV